MKRTVRENLRKYKVNQFQTKPAQSQSPPHKKLLQKIENVYRPETTKYEHSMPDAYVPPEKKEEAQDFRIEIEKRFQKSLANKNFVFPLHNDNDSESDDESSLDSLRHVTVYDLASQNQLKKSSGKSHPKSNILGRDISIGSRLQTEIVDTASEIDPIDESFSDVPIEVRIRDKNSSTYKNLIRLLEMQPMFSHNSTNTDTRQQDRNVGRMQDVGAQRDEYTNADVYGKGQARLNNNYVKQEAFSNFTTQASTTDTQKGFRNGGNYHLERQSGNERETKSSERTGHSKERAKIGSSYDRPASASKGSKTTFIDTGRTAQESLKQLYLQNINASKSITPQYGTINMNDIFSKDGAFKTYNGDNSRVQTSVGRTRNGASSGRSPLENLYQRAQRDIVQNKFRVAGRATGATPSGSKTRTAKHSRDANQSSSTLVASGTPFRRDETPKDPVKKLAFASFYGANSQVMERLSTINPSGIENIIPKQNSAKGLQMISPLKKSNDKFFSTFYENTQPKFFQKAGFKLDLSKRSQGNRGDRDALSSTRNRNKTPDRGYIDGLQNSVMRTSYDTNNNLNGSAFGIGVQKNSSRISEAPFQRGSYKDNSFSRQSTKLNY